MKASGLRIASKATPCARSRHAQIYLLAGDTILPVSSVETEHFTVTRDFLSDHRRALRALLEDDESSTGGD